MSIEFVLCRLKSDHSQTHMIARRGLRRWPAWEPVPDAEEQPAPGEVPADDAPPAPPEEPSDAKPATKSRSRAANDK
ncbi:hypothetical protein BJF79_13835 [Actinomadura sp. CNU-125]|uniref:hypothetical protein n=1 Tax=Actinomadura sp. CNU-125 TaxID=1904961 RepID=UPI00096007D2|nr:hypothetical protein [Actinomadura sp. CNU-125]OLT24418.1 hypothetical protein BJF79_13835 [Actinomadura sp. CNU-125]